METLPLLPGYVFSDTDPLLKDYKVKQKLKYSNGLPVIRDDFNPDDIKCNAKFVEHNPELTYGRPRQYNIFERQRFLPHHALYARKCLSFDAYFKQTVNGSPLEYYRVRRVKIIYYLEDDTMIVHEPKVENAGFAQGKLVKKHRIPKPDGEVYHWKDLNVGINLEIYGIVYRVYSCDMYTREFLTSQGIDVNDPEDVPTDPYMKNRNEYGSGIGVVKHTTKSTEDKLYKFLEYDGMVLSFDASWNDEPYKIMYFLVDDTMAVCKVRMPNDGQNMRGCLILKRTRVPKNWTDVPSCFAGAYLETTEHEVKEYYTPKDLKIGATIFIFRRRFFLHDCDPFTRRYFSSVLHIEQPPAIPLPDLCPKPTPCYKKSEKPAKDLIRKLFNFPKRLRYTLQMEACHPEDANRDFVLEYNLADGCIRINERPKRNSGRQAGCFLGWIRVPKPGTDQYYTPEDFMIGAKLNIFEHWFVVTGTEVFVYNYMEANPDKFDEKLRENVKKYLLRKDLIRREEKDGCRCKSEDSMEKHDDDNKEITYDC